MDHDREARALRAEIEKFGDTPRGRRIPSALRARIVAHAEKRIAAGASRASICAAIGLSAPTLTRWRSSGEPTLSAAPSAPNGFVRLRVSTACDAAAAENATGSVVVFGPCGLRIDGLSIPQLAELFRMLS